MKFGRKVTKIHIAVSTNREGNYPPIHQKTPKEQVRLGVFYISSTLFYYFILFPHYL